MKKLLLLLFLLGSITIYAFRITSEKPSSVPSLPVPSTTIKQAIVKREITQSIFVPYWTITGSQLEVDHYNDVIYFGITPTDTGINVEDDGYKNLPDFVSQVPPEKKTLLTIRMLDNTNNLKILEQKGLQKKIIDQTIAVAKTYTFNGIVLDFELNAFPFDSVINDITTFMTDFAKAAKAQGLSVSVTIYGDTFYRLRPFNVKAIGKEVDQIYIMAYDLSKSRGNPGPNFPYGGKETYGYDFQTMIKDYTDAVPAEKLAVVFGLYGYDWVVDDQQKMIESGVAMSYFKIKKNYVDTCTGKICQWERDSASKETKLTYTDTDGKKHIIWFEDPESVKAKEQFLQENGIFNFSFWAYSYF